MSSDYGNTWSALLTTTAALSYLNCAGTFGRISLSGSGTTVYAMIGNTAVPLCSGRPYTEFEVSNNLGGSWSAQTVPFATFTSPYNVTIDGTGSASNDFSQSFYDQALAVSPASASTVLFGGESTRAQTAGAAGASSAIRVSIPISTRSLTILSTAIITGSATTVAFSIGTAVRLLI